MGLHVITVYGYTNGYPVSVRKALVAEVMQAAVGLGPSPWLVGGDWNLDPHDLQEVVLGAR